VSSCLYSGASTAGRSCFFAVRAAVALAFVAGVATAGCTRPETVMGVETESARSLIRAERYDFLVEAAESGLQPEEAFLLGTGGGYYLGLIYEELGFANAARELYEAQWARPEEPWRRAAGERLLSRHESDGGYEDASELAAALADDYPDASGEFDRARWRALLGAGAYEELWEATNGIADPEAHTYAAWAAVGMGHSEAAQSVREAARHAPADELLGAFSALVLSLELSDEDNGPVGFQDEAAWEMETPGTLELKEEDRFLLQLRGRVARGEYSDAYQDVSGIVHGMDGSGVGTVVVEGYELPLGREPFSSPVFIEDLIAVFHRTERRQEGAAFLSRLANEIGGPSEFQYENGAARLLRAEGLHREAVAHYRRALDGVDRLKEQDPRSAKEIEGETVDLAVLQLFRSWLTIAPAEAARNLHSYIGMVDGPAQLSPVLERLTARLIDGRRWNLLVELYEVSRTLEMPRANAQLAVVLRVAADAGYVTPNAGRLEEALRAAALQTASPYYGLLAAVILEETPVALPIEQSVLGAPEPQSSWDEYVLGYLELGLRDQSYQAARSEWEALAADTLAELTRAFAERGEYLRAVRLGGMLKRKPEGARYASYARLAYPRPFRPQFREVIKEHALPEHLLYALTREESGFNPEIESAAGAIGLAQLMPATARDIAARLNIADPELTDPAANLSLGGWYLARQLERFEGRIPSALAAYNAGQGNARRWEMLRGELPSVLFHESIPFPETRDYVRKILVSTVFYAYLYDGTEPSETVLSFHPDLPSGPSQ